VPALNRPMARGPCLKTCLLAWSVSSWHRCTFVRIHGPLACNDTPLRPALRDWDFASICLTRVGTPMTLRILARMVGSGSAAIQLALWGFHAQPMPGGEFPGLPVVSVSWTHIGGTPEGKTHHRNEWCEP